MNYFNRTDRTPKKLPTVTEHLPTPFYRQLTICYQPLTNHYWTLTNTLLPTAYHLSLATYHLLPTTYRQLYMLWWWLFTLANLMFWYECDMNYLDFCVSTNCLSNYNKPLKQNISLVIVSQVYCNHIVIITNLPNPLGSELPLWYDALGSLSVPQLLNNIT
jgi:hypothetical protein